ncbi:COX15/CtaA family protein [Pseudonocardia acidicola]|uniref:Heme A synthase n=1 Tax=Pseudonocardia acidicola TaxID=2724939 RepID=A0ABX1SJY4_9PSEU|nr:COX15/CtaA family protein [Pseudonocardia acidicola]NMI01889.1 heme A synthase [Pseudonocardia acidicola]
MRRLAIAAVIAQAGIAVTGSVVRVTGSGLGCPTWPQCFPGSLVPVAHPEVAALRQWVEFSNRLLTFVVVFVAGLCLLAALNTRPRRRRLTLLAAAMPIGVVAQAVIGGITVLTGLAWWTVSVHFLASMVLVWLAVQLVAASTEGTGPARPLVPSAVRSLVAVSTVVLGALLIAGTLVTSAGPHAGDAATPRLALGVPGLAQLHADLLFAYLGLLVGLGFALRTADAPAALRRRYALLVAVVLAQGALGGIQYALGVPEVLVSLHVLGAGLVTVAAAALWAGTVERPREEQVPAAPAGPAPELADAAADRA